MELDALYRDSHWRGELLAGQRFSNWGLYGLGWMEQGAGGVGIGATW